jgi:hypothetical protein
MAGALEVPTGLFVTGAAVTGASEVSITGLIVTGAAVAGASEIKSGSSCPKI